MTLGTRIAVLSQGKLVQFDTPRKIYHEPASRFVAEFIGISNNLSGRADGRGRIEVEGHAVEAPIPDGVGAGDSCLVCVRPEHIHLVYGEVEANGRILDSAFLGQAVRARVATAAGTELVVDLAAADWLANELAAGDAVAWSIRPGTAMVFAGETA